MNEYGNITWNLGLRTECLPGVELGCMLTVINRCSVERTFMIKARTIAENGAIMTEQDVLVDAGLWFTLERDQVVVLPGSLTLDRTDCLLELVLFEKSENEIVSNCVTLLYSGETALSNLYQALMVRVVGAPWL